MEARALHLAFARELSDNGASPVLLLTNYHALAKQALERARSDQYNRKTPNQDHLKVLRGEVNTWKLMLDLYADWESRQARPAQPDRNETTNPDWTKALRQLGPKPPKPPPHGNSSPANAARAAADAGLHPRPLEDEAVLEEEIIFAEPVLDVLRRTVRWLEDAVACEQICAIPLDASMRSTSFRLQAQLIQRVDQLCDIIGISKAGTSPSQVVVSAACKLGVDDEKFFSLTLIDRVELLCAHVGLPFYDDANSSLPTSLEPDAAWRKGARSDPQDVAEQHELLAALWRYIRAGKMVEAQQLCRECRQWWRAASIGGGQAWHFDVQSCEWVGNPGRHDWRRACLAVARRSVEASTHDASAGYEAAVYGTLSESSDALPCVLPVCSGFEDALWARLRLRIGDELEARRQVREAKRMGEGEGEQQTFTPQMLHDLLAQAATACDDDSAFDSVHHVIQASLIRLRAYQLPLPANTMQDADAGHQSAANGALVDSLLLAAKVARGPTQRGLLSQAAQAQVPVTMMSSGAMPGNKVYSPSARAHILRFAAHYSFLMKLLFGGSCESDQLSICQDIMVDYVELLGELVAETVHSDLGSSDASNKPFRFQLPQGVAAVAIMAQALESENTVVNGLSSLMLKLPSSVADETMATVVDELSQILPEPLALALPYASLRAITARLAMPLLASSADLHKAVMDRLLASRWLVTAPSSQGRRWTSWRLHQAISHSLLAIRQAISVSSSLDLLLRPATDQASFPTTLNGAPAVFEAIKQDDQGWVLLMHKVGNEWHSIAAKPLKGGTECDLRVAPFSLPRRLRISLEAEMDSYVFHTESMEVLAALEENFAEAEQEFDPSLLIHEVALPPAVSTLATLMACCEEAEQDAGGLEAHLRSLQTELSFWWTALKATLAYRDWAKHLSRKPIVFDSDFQSNPSAETKDLALRWKTSLERRANEVEFWHDRALRRPEDRMAALPSARELDSRWPVPGGRFAQVIEKERSLARAGDLPARRSVDGLHTVLSSIVPRLLLDLHHALHETGKNGCGAEWLVRSFALADLVSDERFSLYRHLDSKGLEQLIQRLRASAMSILQAGGTARDALVIP